MKENNNDWRKVVLSVGLLSSMLISGCTSAEYKKGMEDGSKAMQEGKYEQAVTAFSTAVKEEPKNEEAKQKLAEAEKKVQEEAKKKAEEEKKQKALAEKRKYAEAAKKALPNITDTKLEMSQVTYDFIVSKNNLFPANTPQDIKTVKGMTDKTIAAKHLNKNATPYFDKIVSFEGNVISISEQKSDFVDATATLLYVWNPNGQAYQILMYKPTPNTFENDKVRFWGVPVGPSAYQNINGGTTNVQVFFGAHVEKIQ
ncbi:tetratricopeptide repeat protein [Aneurinibacillus aneurinilyticus]|uniref:tetratricopeptide repeat protein n=1 Tax=Aneurinibacillus aneurinilyticus TaxID=1391 RepID=UPI0023F35B6A|nr:tetratricopeptide repeat protein [Aneurinibacillus aneurinilyticus]